MFTPSIIIDLIFRSVIGKILLFGGIAFFAITWLNSTATLKERMAWKQLVSDKNIQIEQEVKQIRKSDNANSELRESHETNGDLLLKLVVKGIWGSEPLDPVESETVDLINETRGSIRKREKDKHQDRLFLNNEDKNLTREMF